VNQTSIISSSYLRSHVFCGNGGRASAVAPPPERRRAEQISGEGLLLVTGHHVEAMILKSFLSWTGRLWDFDQFMYEECCIGEDQDTQGQVLTSGWVDKIADDLLKEQILPVSRQVLRRHFRSLVRKGFLYEREDPVYPWEHRIQYRVNLVRIQKALARRGYFLDESVFG